MPAYIPASCPSNSYRLHLFRKPPRLNPVGRSQFQVKLVGPYDIVTHTYGYWGCRPLHKQIHSQNSHEKIHLSTWMCSLNRMGESWVHRSCLLHYLDAVHTNSHFIIWVWLIGHLSLTPVLHNQCTRASRCTSFRGRAQLFIAVHLWDSEKKSRTLYNPRIRANGQSNRPWCTKRTNTRTKKKGGLLIIVPSPLETKHICCDCECQEICSCMWSHQNCEFVFSHKAQYTTGEGGEKKNKKQFVLGTKFLYLKIEKGFHNLIDD